MFRGVRLDPTKGRAHPPSVRAANRTVSPRILRGVRLDPTKGRAHPRRLAPATERYRRGSSEVSVLIRRRVVAISVEISHGVAGVAAVPSEDRVRHLSIWESSPARWAADLDEWRHDLAADVARPSRVGARSHDRGWRAPARVAPHPRRLALPTERYRPGCSEVSLLIRRRFEANSVEILKGLAGVAAVPPEGRVPHLSISKSSPASRLPIPTSADTISPRMSRYARASAPDLTKGWRLPSAGDGGHLRG